MQINNLPASQITEARPSATAAVAPPPPKQAPAPKPAEAKKPETAPAKPEITDVKPTGETTTEGDPTFTLKVNGKDYTATQSEIIALAQKAKGAEAAMKKAAELEKLSSDFLTTFDNDAFGLLVQRHGKEKAKEIAITMVKNLITEEAMDPKDREIEALKAENETHKAAQERAKKEQEDAQRAVKQAQLYKVILTEIDKELNETALPKDKLTLTRVLNFLAAGKKANGELWTVKEAVKAVEIEDMGHASYYAKQYVDGKLPSEKFRAIFGEETFKKLNKEQINLLKGADKIAKVEKVETNGGAEPAPRKRTLSKTKGAEGISEREYRRQFGSLGGI